jgi:hypothetical protein
MKIQGPDPLRKPAPKSGKPAQGGDRTGFARELAGLAEEAQQAGTVGTAAPVGALDTLLAVQQAADDGRGNRRQAGARAAGLLDRLDELRRDILTGAVPRDRLQALANAAAAARPRVEDPRLAEVLDEIDLRAQVELAKLGVGR